MKRIHTYRSLLPWLLLLLALLTGAAFAAPARADGAPETPSAADAARLMRMAAGRETVAAQDVPRFDYDGDGALTERDGIAVLQLLLYTEPALMLPDAPIAFVPCAEVPLPAEGEVIAYREGYNLHGTVYAQSALTSVTVSITREAGGSIYPVTASVTFAAGDNVTACSLEAAGGAREGKALTELIDFTKLRTGRHTLTLSAASTGMPGGVMLLSVGFSVEDLDPLPLTQNKFRDNYSTAYGFFGCDTDRFLFTFTRRDGRDITTDAAWRDAYIVSSPWGRMHTDAVAHYEVAQRYLDAARVRVSGNGHDSGVIGLSSLIATTSGPYVPRFVSDLTFISHHTFGTAIDINHKMTAYRNSKSNWALIRSEVADHLFYNGIRESSGASYYDFTYTGSSKHYHNGVPENVINYLLYELAYFRAGFRWGYYYTHTCDAMHFTLTDSSIAAHSRYGTGLRKVFRYCD